MREILSENKTAARVLFIINDDGRDKEYRDACGKWDIEADFEHVPYQGFCRATDGHFDVIIVDDYLTHKSGFTLALEIMEKRDSIIFMLGREMDDISVVGALRMGIVDYVPIRTSPAQLAARCAFAAKRLNTRKDRLVRGKDGNELQLDTKNNVLDMGNGKTVELHNMESVILQLLMNNANSYLTKQEIYEKVWEGYYVEGDNTVATHISRLRRKMENVVALRYIETKWGSGYRFVTDPAPSKRAG